MICDGFRMILQREENKGVELTGDDEFVERAVSLLHEQEAWLAEHGSEIREKIEQGYAAAQRGELIDSDQVRSRLDERKRVWLAHWRQA
jgi:hypothetical protein